MVPVGVFASVGICVPGVMDELPWHPARTNVRSVASRKGFMVFVMFLMMVIPPISKNAGL
jgi:hypothetical protein